MLHGSAQDEDLLAKIFCFFSFSIFESGAFHLILALGGVHQAGALFAHPSNVIPQLSLPSSLFNFFPFFFPARQQIPPLDFKQRTQQQQRCAWAFWESIGTSEIFSIFCWCLKIPFTTDFQLYYTVPHSRLPHIAANNAKTTIRNQLFPPAI
jgi:hypothetical protein